MKLMQTPDSAEHSTRHDDGHMQRMKLQSSFYNGGIWENGSWGENIPDSALDKVDKELLERARQVFDKFKVEDALKQLVDAEFQGLGSIKMRPFMTSGILVPGISLEYQSGYSIPHKEMIDQPTGHGEAYREVIRSTMAPASTGIRVIYVDEKTQREIGDLNPKLVIQDYATPGDLPERVARRSEREGLFQRIKNSTRSTSGVESPWTFKGNAQPSFKGSPSWIQALDDPTQRDMNDFSVALRVQVEKRSFVQPQELRDYVGQLKPSQKTPVTPQS